MRRVTPGDGATDAGDGLADRDRRRDCRRGQARRRGRGDRNQRLPVRAGPRRRAGSASGSPRPASRPDAIEQILQLVPIATHNQRGRGTLLVGTTSEIDAETLVDLVERSMSAPGVRAAEAPGRAVRRRARPSPATLRRGLRSRCAQEPARRGAGARGRRFRALTPGESRDDPRSRRARRAVGDGRRAPRPRCSGEAERAVRRPSPTGSSVRGS